jgi:hypothetical protein
MTGTDCGYVTGSRRRYTVLFPQSKYGLGGNKLKAERKDEAVVSRQIVALDVGPSSRWNGREVARYDTCLIIFWQGDCLEK